MESDLAGHATLEGVDEAPCYYPTPAQFAKPLEYIESIRADAERYGICRICPPPGWKPQFAHKPDKLKFATKEQDLVSQSKRACRSSRRASSEAHPRSRAGPVCVLTQRTYRNAPVVPFMAKM